MVAHTGYRVILASLANGALLPMYIVVFLVRYVRVVRWSVEALGDVAMMAIGVIWVEL